MIYTVTEAWSKGDIDVSLHHTTKTPLIYSEAGEALMKMGYTLKNREWFPQESKHEIIQKSLDAMEQRQDEISAKN